MKKISFILFSFLLCFSSFAQPYKSYFGEEYTKWYVHYPGWEYFYSEAYLSCCSRTALIDTLTYQCLFQLTPYNKDLITVPENWTCNAYFREDRNTGQLFFRYYDTWNEIMFPEFIVSDMSVQKGDSVPLYMYLNPHVSFEWIDIVVIDENKIYAIVDSVYYLDDLKHIRTSAKYRNFGYSRCDTLMFVETFGANISPFLDLNPFFAMHSDAPIYTCYETESNLIHFKDSEGVCFWYAYGIKDKKNHLKIRESIMDGILTLFFEENFSGQINLLDFTGKILLQKNVSNQTNYNINVDRFPKGIYILSLQNNSNEFLNKKIVIF